MRIYEDILFLFISTNIFTLSKQIILVISWDFNMQEGPIYQIFSLLCSAVTSVTNIAVSCFEKELEICMR